MTTVSFIEYPTMVKTAAIIDKLISKDRIEKIPKVIITSWNKAIIDPKLIDKCLKLHFKKKDDYTTNTLKFSFPDGLDVEIINLDSLLKSQKIVKNILNNEHVTPFIRSSKIFKKINIKNSLNYGNRRWTLDYLKDYYFLKKVCKYFSPNIYYSWKDIIKAEKKNKFLISIKER